MTGDERRQITARRDEAIVWARRELGRWNQHPGWLGGGQGGFVYGSQRRQVTR